MKHYQHILIGFVLMLAFHCSNAQPYRVQVAAYIEQVPFSYFSDADLFGVYMLTDQNNIYRYYIGEFREKEEAIKVRDQARAQGFKYASIIDVYEQKQLCGTPCPYFSETTTYADESTDLLTLTNIFFGFDQATLSSESREELDRVADLLLKNPHLRLLVSGHTDSKGSADYNIALSKRRARNSKYYLINKGVKPKRIIAQVFGESEPEKDNLTPKGDDSPEGRQFNRRVVLAVYDPKNGQVILTGNGK